MGYSTDFEGSFKLNKKLDKATLDLLKGLAATRRVKRKGLAPAYGVDGEFFIGTYISYRHKSKHLVGSVGLVAHIRWVVVVVHAAIAKYDSLRARASSKKVAPAEHDSPDLGW